ncbi:MAG: sulfur carrier protein ThiS [Nitrospiraceae bacterium]
MQIQVNGQTRETTSGTTVADLLRELNITGERVAVEVNLDILDRRQFDRRCLLDGDRIEIISFIGGGNP